MKKCAVGAMMRSSLFVLCSAVAAVSASGSAGAVVLAAWDFQTTTYGGIRADSVLAVGTYTTPLPRPFVANFGSDTLFPDGTNGSSDFYMRTTGIYGGPAATARGEDGRYTEHNVTRGTAINADTSIGMSTDGVNLGKHRSVDKLLEHDLGCRDVQRHLGAQRRGIGVHSNLVRWLHGPDRQQRPGQHHHLGLGDSRPRRRRLDRLCRPGR